MQKLRYLNSTTFTIISVEVIQRHKIQGEKHGLPVCLQWYCAEAGVEGFAKIYTLQARACRNWGKLSKIHISIRVIQRPRTQSEEQAVKTFWSKLFKSQEPRREAGGVKHHVGQWYSADGVRVFAQGYTLQARSCRNWGKLSKIHKHLAKAIPRTRTQSEEKSVCNNVLYCVVLCWDWCRSGARFARD